MTAKAQKILWFPTAVILLVVLLPWALHKIRQESETNK